jgi:hypothetical protein
MNKDQAMAMLKLIADLYQIIQAPDPESAPVTNGQQVKEPADATR